MLVHIRSRNLLCSLSYLSFILAKLGLICLPITAIDWNRRYIADQRLRHALEPYGSAHFMAQAGAAFRCQMSKHTLQMTLAVVKN